MTMVWTLVKKHLRQSDYMFEISIVLGLLVMDNQPQRLKKYEFIQTEDAKKVPHHR